MKNFKLFSIAAICLGSIIALSNSGGRASVANAGNTGAPGDEVATCVTCHNGSAALATSTAVSLLDDSGEAVSTYTPGSTYTVRVEMTTAGSASGHGFQMIALDGSDNDLAGFADAGANNNYKLKTITNGRTYAEHDGISTSNVFDVEWTAPAMGSGAITFYASGNSVNGNGVSSGDGAATTTMDIAEGSSSSTNDLTSSAPGTLGFYPNPVQNEMNVRFVAQSSGLANITIFSLDGKQVFSSESQMIAGENRLQIDAAEWNNGAYFLSVKTETENSVVRILK